MTKKEQIIAHATRHFNQYGFGSSSLHQLAQAMGMSRGNLSYHFKTKELLLEAINDYMWSELEVARSKIREFPSFENLQKEIKLFRKFQKEYAFIFMDAQLFLFPAIKKRIRQERQNSIDHSMSTIQFSIQMGNMKSEQIPGSYHNICRMIWMITFYWTSQEAYLENPEESSWDKMIWSILLPHFTEKGIQSFISFFGEEYYQSLGEAFDYYHHFSSF